MGRAADSFLKACIFLNSILRYRMYFKYFTLNKILFFNVLVLELLIKKKTFTGQTTLLNLFNICVCVYEVLLVTQLC